MKLPSEGARWLVLLRYWACGAVFLAATVGWVLGVLPQPLPLVRGRMRHPGLQPVLQVQPAQLGGRPAERREEHLPASALRSDGPDHAALLRRFPAQPVSLLLRVPHDHRRDVPAGPIAVSRGRVGYGHGGRHDALGILAVDSPFRLAFPLRSAEPGADRRPLRAQRVCGAGQHVVDCRVLHHGHPPLRGPGPRRAPPERETPGDRPVGGRHCPPDRQSFGRRAELPAENRGAGAGRSALDGLRSDDGGGAGPHRADRQAGAIVRPAPRHHAAIDGPQRGGGSDAALAGDPCLQPGAHRARS